LFDHLLKHLFKHLFEQSNQNIKLQKLLQFKLIDKSFPSAYTAATQAIYDHHLVIAATLTSTKLIWSPTATATAAAAAAVTIGLALIQAKTAKIKPATKLAVR